ncbi:MAG: polyprenyl synthetase family protein [Alphaproteobacteria bacterium]|nr:polyprenyl synthetase family protein [Alphaproteobacteria bacterium]
MEKTSDGARSKRLSQAMGEAAEAVEATLGRLLPEPHGLHRRIHEAMRYATFAGGKRLRPFLVLHSAGLFSVNRQGALRAAAAIEVLHTYSLVHDDLPCMDDDDLRRGRPTTHKAFDEATAVLAGDALLTVAFEILAREETHASAEVRCRLITRLAEAAGSNGMIGGQMIDMVAADSAFGADEVILLQRLKTGQLFEFACEAGPILGQAAEQDLRHLRDYARDMGLVFQITDDLLDVTSTAEKTGKAVGKDQDHGKATLVSVYGIDGARREAATIADRAVAALDAYGPEADELRALPPFLLDRET